MMIQGVASSSSWRGGEDQILKTAIMSSSSSSASSVNQPYNIPPNWQSCIAQMEATKPPLEEVLNRTCHLLQAFNRDLSALIINSQQQQQQQVADHLAGAASTGPPTMQKLAKRKMWTPEEHKSFLGGINKFGWGRWKEMAAANLIPTRTMSQITTHAQKYEQHMMMNSNPNKRRRTTRSRIYDITLDNNSNSI